MSARSLSIGADQPAHGSWRLTLCLAGIALCIVALVRLSGILAPLEWRLLDLRLGNLQEEDARHVALVLESEADLKRHGYPLPDGLLATVLTHLLQSGAQVIAVDKFRDQPVAPGSEALASLLREEGNVVWVARFDGGSGLGVRPPPAAREPGRHGCADLVTDRDGVVRRALLAQESAGESCLSLPLVAVLQALSKQGRSAGFLEPGDALALDRALIPRLTALQGGYSSDELGGFQVALPHRARQVPAFPLDDIVRGPIPALKGKVVFLGSAAASLGDRHRVPGGNRGESGYVAGVEVHARQAEDLMRLAAAEHAPVRPPPFRVDWMSAALIALLAAWAVLRSRTSKGLRWGLPAAMLMFMSAGMLAEASGWRAELIPMLLAGLLSLGLAWAMRVRLEQADKQELRALFSRQVAPEVADALWRSRKAFFEAGRILPAEVQVTVLFADLRGFTTVTESLPPDSMVAWLNGAIDAMTRTIMDCGGVVTRFGGDQVMAVWGVPVPRSSEAERRSDARQAVRAGLRIRDALDQLNARHAALALPPARVRVGIHSGQALQAGIGSEHRFEFTVLGDAVNTAARLESLTGEDDGSSARILAGDATLALCGTCFSSTEEGIFTLKGKAIPVTVHRILGEVT